MIPGRAIKVRVGSKSTKDRQTHTHTRTNPFGPLELQFGHPLLKSCRWLLLPLLSYLHFPNNALRPLVWLILRPFSPSVSMPVCSLYQQDLWGGVWIQCLCFASSSCPLLLSGSNNDTNRRSSCYPYFSHEGSSCLCRWRPMLHEFRESQFVTLHSHQTLPDRSPPVTPLLLSTSPIILFPSSIRWVVRCGTVDRSKCHTTNDAATVKKPARGNKTQLQQYQNPSEQNTAAYGR